MAKSESKSGATIGSASLILIFIVLCLGTFGLLSLSSAKNDLDLAERNGRSVSSYYRADAEGEAFLAKVDALLQEGLKKNPENPEPYIQEALGSAWLSEEQCAAAEIAMEEGQALSIRLRLSWEKGEGEISILQWKVYNQVEYEIDQDMPVWDGTSDEKEDGK